MAYRKFIKPFFDRTFSLVLLVLLFPFLFCLTFVLLVSSSGKPFFCQSRPGKNGKTFKLIKFRTMKDIFNSEGVLLPDNKRTTRTGRFIRSFSIDELPQLLNILTGNMSFIGPRPLLKEYLPLYSSEQARRHEVRPGLTGWAQVNGRNAITWTEKLKFDVWYVDNMSFFLDMKIFLKTIFKVFNRQGVNSTANVTMEPFKGNN
ncbi:MAG TPA: sugar transferase [Bacteroidales bacterium]|nr:sugar transferase [Bacteroidales bacterium]